MSDRFLLRRTVAADSAALSVLGKQTFRETNIEDLAMSFSEQDIEQHFRSKKSPEWFATRIADPLRPLWVIEDKTTDDLVAFVTVCPCKLPHPEVQPDVDGEIDYLYIRRDRQSQGIGQKLMAVALSWLEAEFKGRPIWLATLAWNLKAQKFYKCYGFTEVGEYYSSVGEEKRRELIMRRDNVVP